MLPSKPTMPLFTNKLSLLTTTLAKSPTPKLLDVPPKSTTTNRSLMPKLPYTKPLLKKLLPMRLKVKLMPQRLPLNRPTMMPPELSKKLIPPLDKPLPTSRPPRKLPSLPIELTSKTFTSVLPTDTFTECIVLSIFFRLIIIS